MLFLIFHNVFRGLVEIIDGFSITYGQFFVIGNLKNYPMEHITNGNKEMCLLWTGTTEINF